MAVWARDAAAFDELNTHRPEVGERAHDHLVRAQSRQRRGAVGREWQQDPYRREALAKDADRAPCHGGVAAVADHKEVHGVTLIADAQNLLRDLRNDVRCHLSLRSGAASARRAACARPPEPWEPPRRGSTVRENKDFRRILIFPPASEPADGRM